MRLVLCSSQAAYIGVIMSIPAEQHPTSTPSTPASSSSGRRSSGRRSSSTEGEVGSDGAAEPQAVVPGIITAESASLGLAAAAAACMLGNSIAAAVGFGSGGLAFMAVLASGMAMVGAVVAKRWSKGALLTPFAGEGSGWGMLL
jgi:hypothetical protein